ncbi:MAG: M20/M25/M40 family metallo-hydrolase [Erythrobacter sp.]|nr:M20/M25/M40 family metallo-hydrolase [Erythrobacter sp.]
MASAPPAEREAIAARLTQDIETLASDEFAGRQPGTPGGEKTVEYLTQRFAEVGLTSGTNDPGNPWRAPVRLTRFRADTSKVEILMGARRTRLSDDEAIAVTTRQRELIAEADLVFVGYEAESVPAEAVMGKVAVMLADASLNPERRILLEAKQAAAVIVVPDVDGALDGFFVAKVRTESGPERVALTGEIDEAFGAVATKAAMARVLGEERWEALMMAARQSDFTPVDIDASVSIEATSERRDFTSYNILGRLPGTRPNTEAVLLLAHWDHLGFCGPEGAVDRICNGAVDNASGVSAMLELAQRLADGGPYERDIYVLATTAEEAGLLGAKAFAANPPVPLKSLIAAFNFDSVAIAPAGAPVGFVGEGRTPLDPLVLETLLAAERDLGDRAFADRFVQRIDSWVLLQEGVPAVMLSSAFGSEITTGPFFEGPYHSPSDEAEGVELGGAIDDLLLHEALVRRLAIPARETGENAR